MTSEIRIAVVNQSELDDRDVMDGVAALQKQVSEDFGPVWQVDARLVAVPRENRHDRMPGHWGLILLDETRHPAAEDDPMDPVLGYHDLTTGGLPLSRVFVNRVPAGQDWTHWASHELLEMLVDPDVDTAVYGAADGRSPRFHAREVCDPCAAYANGYECAGRHVADFVFPSWFRHHLGVQEEGFDERHLISHRFEVLPHGYVSVFDPGDSVWRVLDETGQLHQEPAIDSRPEIRLRAHTGFSPTGMKWSP